MCIIVRKKKKNVKNLLSHCLNSMKRDPAYTDYYLSVPTYIITTVSVPTLSLYLFVKLLTFT